MRVNEYVDKLPDSYKKASSSNNYKLLQLEQSLVQGLRDDIEAVNAVLDIYSATGATLDLYGAMYRQVRGGLTDEQYRYAILQKAAQCMTEVDYDSIVNSVSVAFDVPASDFVMQETDNPAEVEVLNLPYSILLKAGITKQQMTQIIKAMLPAGVSLASLSLEGSFQFSAYGDEYDESAGFGSIDQTIGGYFGMLGEDETDIPD